ncbi:hypothetical protein YB2330_000045 [Saitoella coloradoensis]
MSRVVFVGNIPYDQTEEQMIALFEEVGKVLSFRLVFDRETGKPRGYGFCEFMDHETASSAVRNMNNYDIGGRTLRVDFAESESATKPSNSSNPNPAPSTSTAPPILPPLPPGTLPPPSLTIPDAISRTLQTAPPMQLLDILASLKHVIHTAPDQARALLSTQPQLAYAVVQAMLMMNLMDASVLQRVVASTGAPPPPPQAIVPPPVPVAVAPAPQFVQAPPAQTPEQIQRAEMIRQVMALTDAQIAALPPGQQQQILMLKQSIASGVF